MVVTFRIIKIADGIEKLLVNEVFCRFTVALLQCSHKRAAVFLLYPLVEPLGNGLPVNFLYLHIRNRHLEVNISLCVCPFAHFLQISGEKQEVPKVVL